MRNSADHLGGDGSANAAAVWQPPSVEFLHSLLSGFEVLALLGRGGMGAVYSARQESLDRVVAIKVLPPPEADDALRSAERFEIEARTMARMNHTGIVAVYDFGRTEDRQYFYFVMEFVDGADLAKAIHGSKRFSQDSALAIVGEVCDALGYAHAQGVVHRDIKPANILINAEGQVKVTDFGLARIVDPSQTHHLALTQSNVAMGTPDYAAPEVLTPPGDSDARTDIYSVGVMLYQMLTGDVPRGLFKMPSQKCPELDSRFDAIICKAMEPERDERYQTALEVREDLEQIRTTALPIERGEFSDGRRIPKPVPSRLGFETRSLLRASVIAIAVLVSFVIGLWPENTVGGVPTPAAAGLGSNLPIKAVTTLVPQPPPPPGEGWISLLAELNVAQNSLMDTWRLENGQLRTPPENAKHQMIELPFAGLPSDYDLRIQMTRHHGIAAVVVGFLRGDAAGFMLFDSWTNESKPYMSQLGITHGLDLHETITHRERLALGPDRFHTILLEIRGESVTASVDGEVIIDWEADWTRISQTDAYFFPASALGGRPILGVGACATDATFHRIDLREVVGEE